MTKNSKKKYNRCYKQYYIHNTKDKTYPGKFTIPVTRSVTHGAKNNSWYGKKCQREYEAQQTTPKRNDTLPPSCLSIGLKRVLYKLHLLYGSRVVVVYIMYRGNSNLYSTGKCRLCRKMGKNQNKEETCSINTHIR